VAVIKGARAGFIYHLNKPYILIGRGKVDLIIPDKEISRKHLAIEVRNEKIFLRDLGSTNGTFINDDKVSITEITDQTEFKIGQTTLMLITTSQAYEK
jgi:pSer/pThr/pTyr-binding forkhead associated (FHA) protein